MLLVGSEAERGGKVYRTDEENVDTVSGCDGPQIVERLLGFYLDNDAKVVSGL